MIDTDLPRQIFQDTMREDPAICERSVGVAKHRQNAGEPQAIVWPVLPHDQVET
jgi:hypothetical protein